MSLATILAPSAALGAGEVAPVAAAWRSYFATFPAPSQAPLLRQSGLDLGAPASLDSFLRVMERARVEPVALAALPSAERQALALRTAVGAYAGDLASRADDVALARRGDVEPMGLTRLDREFDDLSVVKPLVPAERLESLRRGHQLLAALIDRRAPELGATVEERRARLRRIGRLWSDTDAGPSPAAEPEAVAAGPAKRARKPEPAWSLHKPGPGGLSRARLEAALTAPRFEPAALLLALKSDPDIRAQYAKSAGVSEGHSIERHTLMVLGQFEKYFPQGPPGGFDRSFFRLVLALHDIGKGRALEAGSKRRQHEFTAEAMRSILGRLEYEPNLVAAAVALIDGDPIGRYLQGSDLEEAALQIEGLARRAGLPAGKFFEGLLALYMADAGSYTRDAGGPRSLDYLFVFDPAGRSMRFSPEFDRRIAALKKRVADGR